MLPRVEIGVVSPETKGVLIKPRIGITFPFPFFVRPRETSTPFPLRRENEFSIPPTSQIPFINSSPVYVSSSLFALQKPAKSPLPSQKAYTCYKVSPSQNTFAQPDFSAISLGISIPFCLIFSQKFPHSSLTPPLILPPLRELFFSHIFLLCFLLS